MTQSIHDVTDPPRAQDRQCSPTANFVFAGERRSATAIVRGLRWEDGRLCARTLHDALSAIGLDPRTQHFLNLFRDDTPGVIDSTVLDQIRSLAREGWVIVAMGRIVQEALVREGVVHRPLVHPAARGAIRARARYRDHVARVLSEEPPEGKGD